MLKRGVCGPKLIQDHPGLGDPGKSPTQVSPTLRSSLNSLPCFLQCLTSFKHHLPPIHSLSLSLYLVQPSIRLCPVVLSSWFQSVGSFPQEMQGAGISIPSLLQCPAPIKQITGAHCSSPPPQAKWAIEELACSHQSSTDLRNLIWSGARI